MPWFYCSICCDTIKKPKIAAHARGCPGATYTCIDCSRTFTLQTVQAHTSCVTETQKYVDCATKPGGFAQNGFVAEAAPQNLSEVVGSEYLSKGPPWRCSLCNVTCTSEATLLSHAQGLKHKRRVRAAAAAAGEGGKEEKKDTTTQGEQNITQEKPESPSAAKAEDENKAPRPKTPEATTGDPDPSKVPKTKRKKKQEAGSSDDDPAASKRRKKHENGKGDDPLDVSNIVSQVLLKKGGTVKLQKLVSAVTKKLAKRDSGSGLPEKEDILSQVLAADSVQYQILVQVKGEE